MITTHKVKKVKKLEFFTIDHIGYGLVIFAGFDFNEGLGCLMILFSFFAILHNYHQAIGHHAK